MLINILQMWLLVIVSKSCVQTHLDHFTAVVTLVTHSLDTTIVMVWKLHDQCMHLPSPNIPTSDVNECATNNGRGPWGQWPWSMGSYKHMNFNIQTLLESWTV